MKNSLWQTAAAAAFAAAAFAVAGATAKPVQANEGVKRPQIAKRTDAGRGQAEEPPAIAKGLE
ncbi:MAG: hypothetical protein ACTSUD_04430, partial [Alphaproteobacteria bacterium]